LGSLEAFKDKCCEMGAECASIAAPAGTVLVSGDLLSLEDAIGSAHDKLSTVGRLDTIANVQSNNVPDDPTHTHTHITLNCAALLQAGVGPDALNATTAVASTRTQSTWEW
jgi:hypothetical protein